MNIPTPPSSPGTADPASPLRDWATLDADEQTRLQVTFGHYLDTLPPTCSLETKIERFRGWLAARGVSYQG